MSTTTRAARNPWPSSMPELVGGVLEVAELVHQPLGVERPALAVAGDPAQAALPAVEHVACGRRSARTWR